MKEKGFTLIELFVIITVIGIIAAGGVLLVTNVMNRSKFDATTKRMDNLKFAIIGNPNLMTNNARTDFGYNGDMGRLPTALSELVTQGGQPAWNLTTQSGWHGPYIRSPFQEDPNQYKRDAWGNDFVYNNLTGVITSYGGDGVAGGSSWAADINSEAINTLITNNITVKVFDARGNPATGATITVYYPVNGTETPDPHLLVPGDSGMWTSTNKPTGMRRIVITFAGETYTKWVPVVPTTTVTVDYKITASPTTPNAPTGLSAVPYSTTQINLSWTAPTLNTDGTSLVDLVSYNIYRGIAAGAEIFFINTGNTNNSFANTEVTEAQRYYYKVSAVNSGANESVQSAETNANASPIQQNVGLPAGQQLGEPDRFRRIGIRNYGNTIIRISTIQLTWVASANPRNIDRIRMRVTAGAWTTVLGPGESVPTPSDVISLDTTYNLSPATNYEMELRYGSSAPYPTLTSLTIRLNTSDSLLIVF